MNTVTSEPSSISDETKKYEAATECEAKAELVSDEDDVQIEPENDGNMEHKEG